VLAVATGILLAWLAPPDDARATTTRYDLGEVVSTGGYDPPLEALDGREVYNRVLENRFDSYVQLSSLISGDRAGNDQETRLRMWFKSFRDGNRPESEPDTLSKTLVRYTYPFDIRHSGYLIINNEQRPNDQFVYLATNRRVRRVNLRGEAVFGTDFSFEDVIPKELDDADYRRLPDGVVNGVPCFVVEAVPKPYRHSEYSRLEILIEKERAVPLRTRYWDERGILVKQLSVDRSSIERIEGLWIPRRMTMEQLQLESYTTLKVVEIVPNAPLERTMFDLRRLEGH